MTHVLLAFAEPWDSDLAPLVLGVLGIASGVLVIAMIMFTIIRVNREVERTRREISAYVAEGSISADDAQKLLKPMPWWSRSGAWCGVGAKPKGQRAEA